MTLIERARRYVAAMPPGISGQGRHIATVNVANVLLHGFSLTDAEAWALLKEYNERCEPPSDEKKLGHRFETAKHFTNDEPEGWLIGKGKFDRGDVKDSTSNAAKEKYRKPKAKPQYDATRLREFAGSWAQEVDLVWLANRSALDPALVSSNDFLEAIYGSRERVLAFSKVDGRGVPYTQGEALWPDDDVPSTGRCGVWYLPQPVSGEYEPNPRTGKTSRRSEESVQRWPFLVLESDDAPLREWMGALARLPLRISALYTSGGRSVHALVRIDAVTKAHWDDVVKRQMAPGLKFLVLNGADPGVFSAVRLSRLPGALREGKMDKQGNYVRFRRPELQKLLYVNPSPHARPLCETPPRRDVVEEWADVPFPDEQTLQALSYYARVSDRCRERLEDLRRER